MGCRKATDLANCGMTFDEIKIASTSTHKNCSECGTFKSLEEYYASKGGLLGRVSMCKVCFLQYNKTRKSMPEVIEASRAYYRSEKRKAASRRNFVNRTYGDKGLEIEDRRLDGHPCDSCGNWTDPMHLDHDHTTGEARGLLCRDCNLVLGIAKDSPNYLQSLIKYLDVQGGIS